MNRFITSARTQVTFVLVCLLFSGCASVVRNPLPEAFHQDITVLGQDDLRYWGDSPHVNAFPDVASQAELEERYAGIMDREHNYLVISGGGANGAYGAGVLRAWTELGTRPEFTIVTGVSTGALIAPFAFLGSDYDEELETFYTTLDTERLIDARGFFALFGADSIVDTTPLKRVLEEAIDDDMIAAIAREHEKGRILAVGTTHMDAGRSTVWNVTRIAASGHPGATKLVREVLLASASIQGAFPPVYIEVEARDGNTYDEMHSDGGGSSQMFFYPAGADWDRITELLRVQGQPTIWVIRNGFLHAQYETVEPRLLNIAGRTISSLTRTQGIGDFFRIWTLARRDGLQLEVTWIPVAVHDEIEYQPAEAFDPVYMQALFEFAYRQTLAGETWRDFETMLTDIDRVDPGGANP